MFRKVLFIAWVTMQLSFTAFAQNLVFNDEEFLDIAKKEIQRGNLYFVNAYESVINDANNKLKQPLNPVTLKTQVPPSGDKHDYISIGPYWWPDPSKPDGLPWINKDGQINPDTRGDHTDVTRFGSMRSEMHTLGIALYLSDDDKYAQKIKDILNAWFIDPATKMNPNLKYAQAVPGRNDGRPMGIIEWGRVGSIITAIQVMELKNKLTASEIIEIKAWFASFLLWLETSDLGIEEGNTSNNHAVWYDKITIGLNIFLEKNDRAKEIINQFKTKRIQTQIEPDGSMPHELRRTKSISYTGTNMEGLIDVAKMAEKVGIDLWGYETADGRGIAKTFEFIKPYINDEKTWTWKEIGAKTKQEAFEKRLYPLIAKASRMFNTQIMPVEFGAYKKLNNADILAYPPLSMPEILGGALPESYVFVCKEKATVEVTGTVDIAYGANGQYFFLYNQTTNCACTNEAFGGDPIKGVAKKCYVKPSNQQEEPVTAVADFTADSNSQLTIYPNPASTSFTIHSEQTEKIQVSIYSLNGAKVYQSTTESTNEQIKIGSKFSPGLYIVKVDIGKERIHKRLIIK